MQHLNIYVADHVIPQIGTNDELLHLSKIGLKSKKFT